VFRVRTIGIILVAISLLLLTVGCETTQAIPGASRDLLDFLNDGTATREEVVLKLGQPSASFEQERILTYRIGENTKQGYFVITPNQLRQWLFVNHSLVLVFDNDGILKKHSLVDVQ